jgi:hypothetical protein
MIGSIVRAGKSCKGLFPGSVNSGRREPQASDMLLGLCSAFDGSLLAAETTHTQIDVDGTAMHQ